MTDPLLPSRRAALMLGAGLAALAASPAAFAQEAKEEETVALEDKGYALGDIVMGDPDAPVTIIEYASLTCNHCGSFHQNSLPEIKKNYIDTGKAKLILREVFFDQFGLWSAMIARCGGDMGFYRLIDQFMAKQDVWYFDHVRAFNQTKNAQPIIDDMMKIGRLAGLSDERMNACLSDQELLDRMLADFQTNSAEDNVRSTPTFFVNGEEVSGAVSASAMAEVIEKHL